MVWSVLTSLSIVAYQKMRDNNAMDNTVTYAVATQENQREWDNLVSHPLQSWDWGEFRKKMGVTVLRILVYENKKAIAAWQVTFHPIPHTPFTVGYFPKGPLPSEDMIRILKEVGKLQNAISIQIEPDVLETTQTIALCKKLLSPAPHPLFTKHTFIMDLTKSEDTLLASFHPKTRYNIKVATRHSVVIKEDNSNEAFTAYQQLSQETTRRQGFYAHNQTYHQRMWETMRAHNIAHLFTATVHDTVVAAWIIFVWKNTAYYPYGASGREHRETMAPTLLLWEIVKWAKKEGMTAFDLWGALSLPADNKDAWYGFHRFKEGFSPKHVTSVGSYDLIINALMYRIYTIVSAIRWTILRHMPRK